MKLNLALYIISISLYSISSPLFAYESEMRVYDIKTHAALGFYQRMGTIDGCESGIVKMNDQSSIHVVEKPTQKDTLNNISTKIIGYIKYRNPARESGNPSKRSYLYQIERPHQDRTESDNFKKKRNHLIP